ncbi:hypothetical protein K0U00_50125, partial [Paenibacillus sepulcri]|nr:hypothetical protein [Paenibacillus sepulcri]
MAYREAAASAAGNEQTALLERALAANPYWSRIRVELSQLVPPLTGARQLEAGLRYEPQSVPLLSALGLCHARLGNVKQAAAYLRLALQYDHYDRDNQTGAIMTMARLA